MRRVTAHALTFALFVFWVWTPPARAGRSAHSISRDPRAPSSWNQPVFP